MPGHTPGTLSYLFEVQDQGKPLRVAYVGGTAIPFNASPAHYDTYIVSSKKMAQAAADFRANFDVVRSCATAAKLRASVP
jgi:glyoxylase-like metal-dependent hydrolase (beta-lactamase superfamily II)